MATLAPFMVGPLYGRKLNLIFLGNKYKIVSCKDDLHNFANDSLLVSIVFESLP